MKKYVTATFMLLTITGLVVAQNQDNTGAKTPENVEKPGLGEEIINYRFKISASTPETAIPDKYSKKEFEEVKERAEKKLEKLENNSPGKKLEKFEETAEEKLEKFEKTVKGNKSFVSLEGFITFRTGGYTVETDSKSGKGKVSFYIDIESPPEDSMVTQQLDQKTLSEEMEVKPGNYTVKLSVRKDGEVIYSREKKVRTGKTSENAEYEEEKEKKEEKRINRSSESLEEKTKAELIKMVRQLRNEVQELRSELRKEENSPETIQGEGQRPGEGKENVNSEAGEGQREGQGRPEKAPAEEKSRRPGFVDSLLNSIFG